MNNKELTCLEEISQTHCPKKMKEIVQDLLDSLESLEEIDSNKKYRDETVDVINEVCKRNDFKVVYVIDKGKYLSMGTVKEKGSKLKVITIKQWIELMDAKIGGVQDKIHEILNDKD